MLSLDIKFRVGRGNSTYQKNKKYLKRPKNDPGWFSPCWVAPPPKLNIPNSTSLKKFFFLKWVENDSGKISPCWVRLWTTRFIGAAFLFRCFENSMNCWKIKIAKTIVQTSDFFGVHYLLCALKQSDDFCAFGASPIWLTRPSWTDMERRWHIPEGKNRPVCSVPGVDIPQKLLRTCACCGASAVRKIEGVVWWKTPLFFCTFIILPFSMNLSHSVTEFCQTSES